MAPEINSDQLTVISEQGTVNSNQLSREVNNEQLLVELGSCSLFFSAQDCDRL